jgi:hypothetical protein
MPRPKKVEVETKVETPTEEVGVKEELFNLLKLKVTKVFDQEPRGSIKDANLSTLVDEILELI